MPWSVKSCIARGSGLFPCLVLDYMWERAAYKLLHVKRSIAKISAKSLKFADILAIDLLACNNFIATWESGSLTTTFGYGLAAMISYL